MATNEELRAAAETGDDWFEWMNEPDPLRRAALQCQTFTRKGEEQHQLTGLGQAMKAVAEAWLREHPADDGEAFDVAWLLPVGFIAGECEFGPTYSFAGLHLHMMGGDWRMQVGGTDGFWEAMEPTRGAVRTIVRILGGYLKEPSHA